MSTNKYDLSCLPLESQLNLMNFSNQINSNQNIEELKDISNFLLYQYFINKELTKKLLLEKINICLKD